jgi:hypothetical protein
MGGMTRRQLLGRSLGAATAGVAMAGGVAALPRALGPEPLAADSRGADGQPLMVYVRPGSSGELQVMHDSGEVVVTDPQLVSRLRSASGA